MWQGLAQDFRYALRPPRAQPWIPTTRPYDSRAGHRREFREARRGGCIPAAPA